MRRERLDADTVRAEIAIVNRLGLHARAAARFVETANRFAADVTVANGEEKVSGKSILGLMMLAAAGGNNFLWPTISTTVGHLQDRWPVLTLVPVALIVSRHTHDDTGSHIHQHKIGNPDWNFPAGQRMDHPQTGINARLLFFCRLPLLLRFLERRLDVDSYIF